MMDKFRRIPRGAIESGEYYNPVADLLNAHSDAIEAMQARLEDTRKQLNDPMVKYGSDREGSP